MIVLSIGEEKTNLLISRLTKFYFKYECVRLEIEIRWRATIRSFLI